MKRTTISLPDDLAAALGRSGHGSIARNIDAILEAEWGVDRDR